MCAEAQQKYRLCLYPWQQRKGMISMAKPPLPPPSPAGKPLPPPPTFPCASHLDATVGGLWEDVRQQQGHGDGSGVLDRGGEVVALHIALGPHAHRLRLDSQVPVLHAHTGVHAQEAVEDAARCRHRWTVGTHKTTPMPHSSFE